MKGYKKTKFFVFATVIVLAVVFLSRQIFAATTPATRRGDIIDNGMAGQAEQYLSPVFATDFSFTVIGFAWQGSQTSMISVRFSTNEGWSEWYSPESMDTVEQDSWQYITEPIVTSPANMVQYRLESAAGINRVKIIYIDSSEKMTSGALSLFGFLFSKASAQSELSIIPRSGWQADESWRFNVAGGEIWSPAYQWPQKFVIHHTAGNDGGTDPAATIRGVYYWQAVVLGWGDIGYNYLIDQEGNIYEGRIGGDGVIGGHVYRSRTCAEQRFGGAQYEANFNEGTIGIAVLGDYENKLALNDTVRDALATLIAYKAKEFDVQPNGTSYLFDNTYANIVGHRDLDCTDCPGMNLYNQLNTVRTLAQSRYESIGGIINPVIKATHVGQSEQPVVVNTGETKEVWVDFRNEGNTTWRNYKATTLAVVTQHQPSDFYVAAWNSPSEVAKLTTPNVAPGEIGRFVFTIQGPTDDLQLTEQFVLKYDDQIIDGTTFSISAQVSGLPYAASITANSLKPAVFAGGRQVIIIQFTNRGTQTWKKGSVKLNVYDLGGWVSRFRSTNWPSEYGQFDFNETEVAANGIATFSFTTAAPTQAGLYRNTYRLISTPEIIQEEQFTITRVDSTSQASLASHTIQPAMKKGWRPYITIQFKNTGLTTWGQTTVLRVYDLGDRVSRFRDSWWLNRYTAARLVEKSVKPGQTGTFRFYFKAPINPGVYLNRFELAQNNLVIQGSGFSLLTRVDK